MNFDITKLFNKKKDVGTPCRIRVLRDMSLTNYAGESVSVTAGTEVEIKRELLKDYERDDITILTKSPAAEVVADPSPARAEPLPAPEGWDRLPSSFSEFWDIAEKIRVGDKHIDEIRATRRKLFVSNTNPFDANDVGKVLVADLTEWKKDGETWSHPNRVI